MQGPGALLDRYKPYRKQHSPGQVYITRRCARREKPVPVGHLLRYSITGTFWQAENHFTERISQWGGRLVVPERMTISYAPVGVFHNLGSLFTNARKFHKMLHHLFFASVLCSQLFWLAITSSFFANNNKNRVPLGRRKQNLPDVNVFISLLRIVKSAVNRIHQTGDVNGVGHVKRFDAAVCRCPCSSSVSACLFCVPN